MIKSDISKEFSRLRNFGFTVFNFNFKKSLPAGLKNFVDHILISSKYLIFVEVKIGKDKLNPDQIDLMNLISFLSNRNRAIHYELVTDLKQTKKLIATILQKKL